MNYTRICNDAKIERKRDYYHLKPVKSTLERMTIDVSPQQRIEDMIRVTELCIDLLKENEEHHGEVSILKVRLNF